MQDEPRAERGLPGGTGRVRDDALLEDRRTEAAPDAAHPGLAPQPLDDELDRGHDRLGGGEIQADREEHPRLSRALRRLPLAVREEGGETPDDHGDEEEEQEAEPFRRGRDSERQRRRHEEEVVDEERSGRRGDRRKGAEERGHDHDGGEVCRRRVREAERALQSSDDERRRGDEEQDEARCDDPPEPTSQCGRQTTEARHGPMVDASRRV